MARGTAVFGHQLLAVRDLIWSGGAQMNVGEKIRIGLLLEESRKSFNLRLSKAVVRHACFKVIVGWIVQPAQHPFMPCFDADTGQFRAKVPANQGARRVLYRMA